MFEKTKYKIGLWIARRQEKKNKRPIIQTDHFFNGIKIITINLPNDKEQLHEAIRFLNRNQWIIQKKNVFICSADQVLLVQEKFPNADIVNKSELTYRKWKIPDKEEFIKKHPERPNLILDLSMDFQLDAVYIWTLFPNAYRVGLYEFEEDQFFDVVFKFKPETAYTDRLKKIETLFTQLK